MADLKRAIAELAKGGSLTLPPLTDGFDAFCVADLTRALAREAERSRASFWSMSRATASAPRAFAEALAFAAPDIEILDFPAWDCQPYDRVSPNASISARRMLVLSRLARSRSSAERPRILCTTVNALVQRVAPMAPDRRRHIFRRAGQCGRHERADAVARDQWFCPRLDACATPANMPCAAASSISSRRAWRSRCGSISSAIRWNRSAPSIPNRSAPLFPLRGLDLVPMSEVQLTSETMRRFRQAYVAAFGAQTRGDALYEAISEGRRHPGHEHWLPLFYEHLDTMFDYAGRAPLVFDPLVEEAAHERIALIDDYYDARKSAL